MSLAEFFTGDFNQRTPAFYAADEMVEIGNEEVSLKLVAATRVGRQMTLLHERYDPAPAPARRCWRTRARRAAWWSAAASR
jgi:hypothetical protein